MVILKFEDMEIWKLSLSITKSVYDITTTPKFSRDFGLRDQIRRAVVSISSNIVEGFEKNNNNEFCRYLKIAKGSAGEVKNQLYIALAVGYLPQEDFDKLIVKLDILSRKIASLIIYLEKSKLTKTQRLMTRNP